MQAGDAEQRLKRRAGARRRTYAVHVAEEECGEAEEDDGPALGEASLLLFLLLIRRPDEQQLPHRIQQRLSAPRAVRVVVLSPAAAPRRRGLVLDVRPPERPPPHPAPRPDPWPGASGVRNTPTAERWRRGGAGAGERQHGRGSGERGGGKLRPSARYAEIFLLSRAAGAEQFRGRGGTALANRYICVRGG
jgi:hypothetical protein